MLSGTIMGPSGDGPRRRHPVATAVIVLLMLGVLFAATFGAVRLLKGDTSATPSPTTTSAGPCVTTTARPGLVLPKPAAVTANVYNATNRAGLARKTSTELKSRGFVVATVANDPLGKSLANVGEIRYGPSGKDAATLMRYYLPGAALVFDQRKNATIDVVLGATYAGIAPQKVVDAALAKPVAIATGSGCPTPGASTKPSTSPSTKPATSPSPSRS